MIWHALAALTLLRLIVAALLPLSPDEAYYWVWSRALAPGYLDHPPMVALWIRAGTFLAGDGRLGIRLLAPLAAALGSVLLARAAGDLLRQNRRHPGPLAAALLNATLLFGVGAVTMTPDTPLLFFWTVALFALARLVATGNGAWWLLAGAATGLAVTSKYTAVLLPAGVVIWTFALPEPRRWLRQWQPWAGSLLGLAIFLPVLTWNERHQWASFAKQGGRGLVWNPARAMSFLGELVGGQVGLATPLVFLLGAAGVGLAVRRLRDPGMALLAALTVPPLLLFVEHALGDRVQANWPAIVYPAAAIAAAGLAGRWQRLWQPAVALGFAMTFLVYLQAVAAPMPLPPRLDPTSRLRGWDAFARAVAQTATRDGARFVAADNYGDAALLARFLPGSLPVIGVEPRWALFGLPDAHLLIDGKTGLLLRDTHRSGPPDAADWTGMDEVTRIPRGPLDMFAVYRVTGRAGTMPAVLLPSMGTGVR